MATIQQFLEIDLPSHKLQIPVDSDDTIESICKKSKKHVDPNHSDYILLDYGLAAKVFPTLPTILYKYTPLLDTLDARQCIGYKLVSVNSAQVCVQVFVAQDNTDPVRHELFINTAPTKAVGQVRQQIYDEMIKRSIIDTQTPIESLKLYCGIALESMGALLGSFGVHNDVTVVITVLLGNISCKLFNVKTLTGKTVPIVVPLDSHVSDIKQAVYDREGIPPQQQRLIIRGKQLTDDDPVDSLAFGEMIYLVMRLRGGGEGSDTIGLSTGGAKDVALFRKKISSKQVPEISDLTYEGLFYEYKFDTGVNNTGNINTDKLFYPVYAQAVSTNPVTGQHEHYLKVGLNSNMKQSEFSRKKLRLTVVLDISGSMGAPFGAYYMDPVTGARIEVPAQERGFSKLHVALQTIVHLLDFLNDDDYFSLVLFDHESYVALPMQQVKTSSFPLLKQAIMTLRTRGSTDFSKGMAQATAEYAKFKSESQDLTSQYEHRIIYLTDAIPNMGTTDGDGLLKLVQNNAAGKNHGIHIHSTVIGIGVDFGTTLIEAITKVRGANYFSVHSSREFKERLQECFEYLVSPLVFDLKLKMNGKGVSIEEVYGSPEAAQSTSEIVKVSTLFPSKRVDGEARGGVILLKLKYDPKKFKESEVSLHVSYEEARTGKHYTEDQKVTLLDPSTQEHYDDTGCNKAVALVRYASFLRSWIKSCKNGKWELASKQKKSVKILMEMFEKVIKEVEDDTLSKEISLLQSLTE